MAKKTAKKKAAEKIAKKKTTRKMAKKTQKKRSKTKTVRKKAAKATKGRPKRAKTKPGAKSPAAREVPNNIGLVQQHVDFLTYKLEQVRKFYGDVLGFRTEQQEPNLNYLVIHVTAHSSLGFMPPHPQMTGEQPPPREPTLYFLVENVDRVFATLVTKGVAFMGPPQEMPWGHRVVMTTDPEGRTVMFGSESRAT